MDLDRLQEEGRALMQRVQQWHASLPLSLQQQLLVAVAVAIVALYLSHASFLALCFWSLLAGGCCSFEFFRRAPVVGSFWHSRRPSPAIKYRQELLTGSVPKCQVCDKPDCARHKPTLSRAVTHPWENLLLPRALDDKLQALLSRMISDYVEFWYKDLAPGDSDFIFEVKRQARFLVATLIRRIRSVDLTDFFTRVGVPIAKQHFQVCVEARRQLRAKGVLDPTPEQFEETCFSLFAHKPHAAMGRLENERQYLRQLLNVIMPKLLSPEMAANKVTASVLREVLVAYALVPARQSAVDPDFLNVQFAYALGPDSAPPRQLDGPADPVELLHSFCPDSDAFSGRSALCDSLDSILTSPTMLKPFMDFLKRESAIEYLMFAFDADEFKQKFKAGSLKRDQTVRIDKARAKATEMFEQFLSPHKGSLKLPVDIAARVRDALDSDDTLPDAAIFEESHAFVRRKLDVQYRQMFLHSDCYFQAVCGERLAPMVMTKAPPRPSGRKSPKLGRKKKSLPELTEAEISAMHLPPPPSAIPDMHQELVEETVKKPKRRLLRRNSSQETAPVRAAPQVPDNLVLSSSPSSPPSVAAQQAAAAASEHVMISASPFSSTATTPRPASSPAGSTSDLFTIDPEISISSSLFTSRPETPTSAVTSSEDNVSLRSFGGSESVRSMSPISFNMSLADDDAVSIASEDIMRQPNINLQELEVRIKQAEVRGSAAKHVVYVMEVYKRNMGHSQYLTVSAGNMWVIERRYREFYKLDQILKVYQPSCSIMELPERKSFGAFDSKVVKQRLKSLQQYISSLVRDQLMQSDGRCAEAIYLFLQNTDDFKKLRPRKSRIKSMLNYVPPVWAARKIMNSKEKSNALQHMSNFLQSFIVTASDLEQNRDLMMQIQSQLSVQESNSSTASTGIAELPDCVPATFEIEASPLATSKTVAFQSASPFEHVLSFASYILKGHPRRLLLQPSLGVVQFAGNATGDDYLSTFIDEVLDELLIPGEMQYFTQLFYEILFEEPEPERTQEQKEQAYEAVKRAVTNEIPEPLQGLLGKEFVDEFVSDVTQVFQRPSLNKQIYYQLLDAFMLELFPDADFGQLSS